MVKAIYYIQYKPTYVQGAQVKMVVALQQSNDNRKHAIILGSNNHAKF